ncbi:SpvB/TcaC N-terminal domain-containing protein [Actinosynnema sp. NPDC051121]
MAIRRTAVVALAVAVVAGVAIAPVESLPTTLSSPGAGSVTAPESPDGASFNPNQLKGIKAADPGANVNLISAPDPNNMGEARLSYPIEVPPGRAGIQPSVAVRYNSSTANGWAGVGWDVAVPSITLETRWGVPRYDAGSETETYLLNGEQLTPVAHRGQLQPRTAEKVFHTRIEGRFERIVRHGDNPGNYWWEVTDKQGTTNVYGGSAETALKDDAGHIATWALRETRDLSGNFARYEHATVTDGGSAGATVPGRNLYPTKITYTGHGTTEGRYSVIFTRDRDRGEGRRQDVQIDARSGFKKVTADLLRRVEVKLDGQLIRAYELNYRTGAFAKTLLQSITQFDADNRPFTTNTFDYYDDIRSASGDYDAFAQPANWQVPDDGLGVDIRDGEAGAVSASTSDSGGGHLYVGYNPSSPSKSNSAGVKIGFNAGSSDGLLALADVNGDNLPDKVFRQGGQVYYRANRSGPNGETRFDDQAVKLDGLPGISSERTLSGTVGIESYFGVAAQLDYVSTTTTSGRYFADVNGDGITDLVNNGGVLFGALGADGKPSYTANSADTGVPVGSGSVSGTIVGDQTAEFERQVDRFPLLDSVRRWVAPHAGTVKVDGSVTLLEDPARADYPKEDGVRVTIQHKGAELWAQRIGPDDHMAFTPSGVGSVTVAKGDALYFRVQSVLDGRFDAVAWDPRITYVGQAEGTDVNGLRTDLYQASRDFTLGGRPSLVTAPLTGTLKLTGDVVKSGSTTDDVTVEITRNGTTVYSHALAAGSGGTASVDLEIPVTANDLLSWRLRVDSPIDAGTVQWTPRAHYTAAQGVDSVVDQHGNPSLVINPPYDLDLYPVDALTAPQAFHHVTADGTVTVKPTLSVAANAGNGRVVFTVKKRGALLAKRVIDIVGGAVPAVSDIPVTVTDGDDLFFDFSTTDPLFLGKITGHSATLDDADVPTAAHASAEQGAFAQPYRGWASIGYQGNRDRATTPIVESDLVLDESYKNTLPSGPTADDVDDFTDNPTAPAPRVAVFAPLPAQNRWAGADDNTWVSATGASSSRYGLDTIDVVTDAEFAGATGVSRRGRTQQISTTFGVSVPGVPVGAGASVAKGGTEGQVDFLDLNGDRFPDVVGAAGIQYSDMVGGLGGTRGSLNGSVRESDSLSYSVSSNAGSPARTVGTARGADAPTGAKGANTAKSGVEMPGLGVSGSLGGGESDTGYDLIDINGDGLPDKVYENGTAALNLGYSFAGAEPWPGGPVNSGTSTSGGLNLGFNTNYYGFAGGLSASLGSSVTKKSLQDMNGDGLADRVFSSDNGPVGVAINTGNGFTAPVPFRGSFGDIAKDGNASLGGGVYFTFGFCFVFGCLVFNPGGDFATGVGRTEVALRDVNGDGYVDHLRTGNDGELVVGSNQTGRTNLLRTVNRPMGGRIDLEYARSGNTTDQPDSRWVMSKASLYDGHPGDGVDTRVSTYRYENGKQDRLEREFLGYGKVTAESRDAGGAVYRTLTTEYRTDSFYAKGLPSRSTTADGAGRLFLETLNTYQLRQEPGGSVFPLLARTDKRFYEGQANPGTSTYAEMSYDEYGNLTRSFDAADAGTADDVEAVFGYTASSQACRDRNLVGGATSMREGGTSPPTTSRRREADVDCANGDVKSVREYLADGSAAVTDMEYSANGNLRKITGPANATGQRYAQEYTYDTVVDTFVESTLDSFGYRSTTNHDIRFGRPTLVVDENNQQLRTSYDSVGRVDDVTGPYEIGTGRVTIDFEYHPEAPVPYAVTRHADRTATGYRDDTIDTVQFIDGVGRALQTKQDASVAASAGQGAAAVMTVSGQTKVDFLGRVVEQYFPVTEPKGAANTAFNATFDTVAPSKLAYDVLDRTVRSELPDATVSTRAYGFGADRGGVTRFQSTATDANGKVRHNFADTRQLTTSVREFNAGNPVWTSYAYDPMGQLSSVTDDKNNVTRTEYDNLGRRTAVDSPDQGRTESRYDLAGNITAKITSVLRAQNKQIAYDYQFNRLAAVRYPTFTGNNVTYTYGAPGAPDNAADRITRISDAAGTVTRAYGPLGETVRETRTVTALVTPERSYTTEYTFDSFNRVLTLKYPDSEVLTYGYDTGGQVNRATGHKGGSDYTYLARLDYDKFGQRLLQETGTGVRTTYAYNPLDRQLANLRSRLPDGHQFQDVAYGYDKVGNVTTLTNTVPLPHGKPVGGPSTQTYNYDDLYRVTSASGQYWNKDNKLDRYNATWTYDSIHNLTAKSQRHEVVVNPDTPPPAPEPEPELGDPNLLPPLGPIEEPDGQTSGDSALDPADPVVQPAAYTGETVQTQKDTTYDYGYGYASGKPHAPSKIGPIDQRYDANGNLVDTVNTEPPAPGKRRQLVWDEENRLACNQDHARNTTIAQDPSACVAPKQPATVRYVYDSDGNRVVKNAGPQHIYPNRNYSERNGTGFKHIFVGDDRIATKTVKPDSTYENQQFFFHGDHLGSSAFVTDEHANLTEHLEYFAFGETWVNEHPAQPTPVPYQYSAKEMDEETGFYYYGARYYNPRTQLWQSPDPMLGSYLDGAPNGGVFASTNLAGYTYANNNPVVVTDPTGLFSWSSFGKGVVKGAVVGVVAGVAVGALIASGGTLAPAIGYAIVAYGAYQTVQTGAQVITGRDSDGRQLSDEQRSDMAGQLVGGAIGGYAGAKVGAGMVRGTPAPEITGTTPESTGPQPEYVRARPDFKPTANRGGAPGSRAGEDFTKAGKDEVLQRNAQGQSDGIARCATCGEKLTKPAQSKRGVTPPRTDAQVDHVNPKANNGSGDPSNGQGLCRVCNNAKSDNVP